MRYFNVYSWDGLKFFGSIVVAANGNDKEVKDHALSVAAQKTQEEQIKLTPGMRAVHRNFALNRL